MKTITVQLKARMATGTEVVYSLATTVEKNTEAARCSLLAAAYECAARQGVKVNQCFHGFVVA